MHRSCTEQLAKPSKQALRSRLGALSFPLRKNHVNCRVISPWNMQRWMFGSREEQTCDDHRCISATLPTCVSLRLSRLLKRRVRQTSRLIDYHRPRHQMPNPARTSSQVEMRDARIDQDAHTNGRIPKIFFHPRDLLIIARLAGPLGRCRAVCKPPRALRRCCILTGTIAPVKYAMEHKSGEAVGTLLQPDRFGLRK